MSDSNLDADQLLRNYARDRDAVADAASPLQPADVRALLGDVKPRPQVANGPLATWRAWRDRVRRHWQVAWAAAAVVVVLAVFFAWPRPDRSPSPLVAGISSVRVVFAASGLRGGEAEPAAGLSLPLTCEIDFEKLTARLVQSNGIACLGSITGRETLQTNPLKRRLALTAQGKDASGALLEFRGTLTVTTEAEAARPPREAAPAKVLGAVLELQPIVAGRMLKTVRLEFPD